MIKDTIMGHPYSLMVFLYTLLVHTSIHKYSYLAAGYLLQ